MSNPANRLPPEYDETLPQDYDPEFTSDISTKMRVPDKIGVRDDDDRYDDYAQQELHRVASMHVPEKINLYGDNNHDDTRARDLHLDLNPLLSGLPHGVTHNYVGLQTPPRVLTLEDRPFPPTEKNDVKELNFEDDEDMEMVVDKNNHNVSFNNVNGYIPQTPPRHPSSGHLPVPNSVKSMVNFPITDMLSRFLRFPEHLGPPSAVRDRLDEDALLATPGTGLMIHTDSDTDTDFMQLKKQVAKLHRHVQRLEDENVKRSQRELVLYPVVVGYFLFQMVKWFMHQPR